MSTVAAVVGILVGLVAIVAACWRLVLAIWTGGRRSQTLIGALDANTAATERLSSELAEHRTATAEMLGDLDQRVSQLELHRSA
jgi:uncharacterized membrane-anchored protein YhcB (DUF1043 family)